MKNKITEKRIKDHYRQQDLEKNITRAFNRAGREIQDYTDTEDLDEFHIRGREATRELARLADFKPGMTVLDLGCGIGGPARMLAAEFGCHVTGVDLVEEYCAAAAMITNRVGLAHRVQFQTGDMTAMTFSEQSFDNVWVLHTLMNIEDKPALFGNVFRILKSGGIFALYEICEGNHSSPYFPVPWATDPSMSFLLSADDFQQDLVDAGFIKRQWMDVSFAAVKWFQEIARKRAASGKDQKMPQGPGISMLLGKTAAEKSKNVFSNILEDRIRLVFGVFQKPGNL